MMTLDEIKENLCYNDLRNPNVTVDEETAKEIVENNADCYCDNCFRGKTALAEELLKYYYLAQSKGTFTLEDMKEAIRLARKVECVDGSGDIMDFIDGSYIENFNNEWKHLSEKEIIQLLLRRS